MEKRASDYYDLNDKKSSFTDCCPVYRSCYRTSPVFLRQSLKKRSAINLSQKTLRMKKLILAFVCLLAIGQLSAQPLKIAGGDEISISEAPYIVSLEINGHHECGGIIIDCEWILTAAHCLGYNDEILSEIIVHAGSTNQTDDGNGQRIGVESWVRHELAMNSPINEYDIALLKLSEPLVFSNGIQPIEYATPENTTLADIAPGQNAFISGWGFTSNSGAAVDLLRGVSLPIISIDEANDRLPEDSNVALDDFHIALDDVNTGSGKGDSGGPAIINVDGTPIVIGIGSWTYPPDYGKYPSIYVNVRHFTDFIESNITENECTSCFDFALDYQLVDKFDKPKTVFCPGEDVFVDVLQILDTDEYYADLWTEDDNGELDWISGLGWRPAESPDGINIINLFENDPETPVTFQEGVNYVLKIAVATPRCGWIEVLRSFTFGRLPIEPADYIFQDEDGNEKTTFCVGEDIWVNGSPTVGENRYEIYAWRLQEDGDKIWFGNLGTFYGDMGEINISARFANLGVPRYFDPGQYLLTIAYYNDDECKQRTPVEKKFEVECCDNFLEASFTPVATELNDNYYRISATNFQGYENHEIVHEWYLMDPSDGSIIASSIGGFQYNQAEFGKNYFLVHKLRTPCGEICYVLGMIYEEGGQLNAFGGDFDCSVLDLGCEGFAPRANLNCNSGIINWNQKVNAEGYVLRIYYDQGECCDTPLGQPDEVVNLSYSQNSFYSPELARAKCVTIQIGVLCEGEITWGPPLCKECCTLDDAPTDLAYNCLTNQGSFSPVAGAEGHVVEVVWNDRDCFCGLSGDERRETLQIGRDTDFSLDPRGRCFSIRVGAKCKGVTVWSKKECFNCFDVMPKANNTTKEELRDLTVAPNPGTSIVKLQVDSDTEVQGVYTIRSSTGILVTQQKGSSLGSKLDVSNYPSGIYFIKFTSELGKLSNVQRLVVKH